MPKDASALFGNSEKLTKKGKPLYVRLQQLIEQAIATHDLKPGDVLPPERDMAEALSISRVTVRRAIDNMVQEGVLTQRQGAGTYISNRVQQPLNHLKGFSQLMEEQNKTVSSRWLERSVRFANSHEQNMLNLSADDEVVTFLRLRLADDLPMALENSTLPRYSIPNPLDVRGSLYHLLEQQGLRPTKAQQRLRAVNIDREKAELLDVPENSAVFYIERIGLLDDGTPIELTQSWFPGDSHDFITEIITHG